MRVPSLLLTLLLALDAAAFVRRGDVVVTQPGGLVRLDPATGVTIEIPLDVALHRPTGVAVLPDGDLLIADWDLPHINFGSVVRARVLDGRTRTVAQHPDVVNPFALVRSPDGRVVLADIDAGEQSYLFKVLLRKGIVADFDPDTGAMRPIVDDCCGFNPTAFDFASPTRIVIAEAGCCAYGGDGQVAIADTITGTWSTAPTSRPWRDPFAVAVSPDGNTAWVAESSVSQPGPAGVHGIDLAGGLTTQLAEGLPLVHPTGLVVEDARRLLAADEGADAIWRIDVADGAVTPVASGPPLWEPASLVRVDVGDDVSGVAPSDVATRACAERAATLSIGLGRRVLRCIGAPAPAACLRAAHRRWPPRAIPGAACPPCMTANRARMMPVVPEALLRTPGQRLDCAGPHRPRLARATARLYDERSRCDGAYLADGDRTALGRCRDAARARFLRAGRGRCDDAQLDRIAAETVSVADAAIGLAYCAP